MTLPKRLSHISWLTAVSLLIACDTASPNDVVLSQARDTVAIMTFNIFHDSADPGRGIAPWPERRGAVVEMIRSRAPDVVGLQEAKLWQVAWLLEQMPEYAAVARGPYADAGVVDAETVAVLFLSERFALRESGHFWYSESPDAPGSYGSSAFGGAAAPRMATWVRLEGRETAQDEGFYVFNTHFISSGQADDPGLARFRSAELLVERIADRAHGNAPFFVTGDLNTGPGSWPLRYLLGDRCESGEPCAAPGPEPRMIDAWESEHPGDPGSGTRCDAVTGADGQRVDHVLVWDPALQPGRRPVILSADIVAWGDGCPSDHRPVAARIVLPGPQES
jgi:endonuclease/exonuclease/phosphatase family metal-dependent hydrolase